MDKRVKRFLSLFMALAMSLAMFLVPAQAYETIKEGQYFLSTALNENLSLDVSGGTGYNGANIQIYESNWTSAQEFTIEHVEDEWYAIKHTASGKFLDVEGMNAESGTNVLLWEYDINPKQFYPSQVWRFIKKNGGYAIQNGLGTYLDVRYGKAASGTNVWAYQEGNDGNAQTWKLTDVHLNEMRLSYSDVKVLKGYPFTITVYFHGADFSASGEPVCSPVNKKYDKGYATFSTENLTTYGTGYTSGYFNLVICGEKSTWSAGRVAGKSSQQHYARYYVGMVDDSNTLEGACKAYLNVRVI